MTHLDLFSGIGGFALAASWVWPAHEVVAFCELEPFAQRILRKHWPATPIIPDIHDLDGSLYADVDLLTGGFPCQPYSVAGKQRGADDDRALWPEMLRVIREARPRWVLAENVAGLIGMGLDGVLSDLEGASYSTGTVVVPACAVDAPHRRDRLWIVAYRDGQRLTQRRERDGEPQTRSAVLAGCDAGRCGATLGDANGARPYAGALTGVRRGEEGAGARHGEPERPGAALGNPDRQGSQGRREHRGCPGERPTWQKNLTVAGRRLPQSGVRPLAHGVPGRVARLRALGNAIVPQVAAEILQGIRVTDDTARADAGEGG